METFKQVGKGGEQPAVSSGRWEFEFGCGATGPCSGAHTKPCVAPQGRHTLEHMSCADKDGVDEGQTLAQVGKSVTCDFAQYW